MSSLYMRVVVPATILLPLVFALVRFIYWKKTERLVFVYLLLSLVFNVISSILSKKGINNLPYLHLYTCLECMLLFAGFRTIVKDVKVSRVLLAGILLFPVFAAIYIFKFHSIYQYNIIPRCVESILLMIAAMYILMQKFIKENKLVYDFNFFFVSGMLMYFSSSLTLFALSENVPKTKELNYVLWNIHATLVLILYVLIAAGYYKLRPKRA